MTEEDSPFRLILPGAGSMTLERCKINYFFSLKSLNLHLEELVEMANPLLSKKPKEKLKVRQLNVKMS